MLLGGRQPGVQRQHLDVTLSAPEGRADRFGGVADLPLTGEEHQHIPRRLRRKFLQRIDDRLGLITRLNPNHLVVGVVRVIRVID